MLMNTSRIQFHNSVKSYLLVVLLGIFAGILTRASDFFPYDTLWSFSSIATLFGFWMLTTTLVIYFSCSSLNAGLNAFLYLFSMSFSFYFFQCVLGWFLPRFETSGFQTSVFLLYSALSVFCGLVGAVLYLWNRKGVWSLLYGLPVGGLLAEAIAVGLYLLNHHTFLFQLLFNAVSAAVLGVWFYRKADRKVLYLITVVATAALGYFFYYRPMIH